MTAMRKPKKQVVDDKSMTESAENYSAAVLIIQRFTRYDRQLTQLDRDYRCETELAAKRFKVERDKILAKISGQIIPLRDLCDERTRDTKENYLDVSGARLKFTSRKEKVKVISAQKIIEAAMMLNESTMSPEIRAEFQDIVEDYQPPTPALKQIVNVKALEKRLLIDGEALPESIAAYVQIVPEHRDFAVALIEGGDNIKDAIKEMRTADGDFIVTDAAGDAVVDFDDSDVEENDDE